MGEQTHRFKITNDVIFQTVHDEAVILNLNDDHYYGLDDVGARMWQLLIERGEPEAVIQQMLVEFAVDDATLRRDLALLIEKMEQAGLITRVLSNNEK